MRVRILIVSAVLVASSFISPAFIHADDEYTSDDVGAAIQIASDETGVPVSRLTRVVNCEDPTWYPYAIGDSGTSLGPVQLHEGGGELPRFYSAGYDDPFNPYQAIPFLAEEIIADRAAAWSCR